MIPAAFMVLLEAALRALVAAMALGLGLRLLRVRNVLAQKAVWGVVLAAALAMPLLMRYGMTATLYVATDFVGKSSTPNRFKEEWSFDRLENDPDLRNRLLLVSSCPACGAANAKQLNTRAKRPSSVINFHG